MIDGESFDMRAFLKQNKQEIEYYTFLITNLAKISIILAGPIGLYLLIVYLQSVRAPLPVTDFSAIQALIIIAGTYTSFLTFTLLMVYLPVLVCRSSRTLYKSVSARINLRSFNYNSLVKSEIKQIVLFQGGALAVLPIYSVLWMSRASTKDFFIWLTGGLLLGAILSVVMFYWSNLKSPHIWQVDVKIGIRVFLGAIIRGSWCVAWLRIMAMLNLAFPIVKNNQSAASTRIVLWSVFTITVTYGYCMITRFKARMERLPIVIFAGLFVALGTFPGFFGKRTLHILGIGGGIPIKILLKTMEPSGKDVVAQAVQGCLLLNAGSRLILQPMKEPTEDACSRELPLEEIGYKNMLNGVEIFSNTDVMRMDRADGGGVTKKEK